MIWEGLEEDDMAWQGEQALCSVGETSFCEGHPRTSDRVVLREDFMNVLPTCTMVS